MNLSLRNKDGKLRFRKSAAALGLTCLVIAASASSCNDAPSSGAQSKGQALTEQAFNQQSSNVKYPAGQLKDPLERKNLSRRLLDTNKPDALGFVYIMNYGKIIGYYTVKGKVSATNSQMTATDMVMYACDDGLYSPPDKTKGEHLSMSACTPIVVTAPGDDGSYGNNEGGDKGIFFYTNSGARVDTDADFFYSTAKVAVGDIPQLG
jgi:hypothetical protein